jgi:hypothetical protein
MNYNFTCCFVWVWSLSQREKSRLKVSENKGLRREAGEDCIMRSFVVCTLHQILLQSRAHGMHDRNEGMQKFWSENLKGRNHLGG